MTETLPVSALTLVEDEMLKLGAIFSEKANWAPHVVSDGLLITGQNPHSSLVTRVIVLNGEAGSS